MTSVLAHPAFLISWSASVLVGLGILIYDLIQNNSHLKSVMKLVWILTVAYSGLIGLSLYFWSGRRQIARDSIWRRATRSVSHCYAGCGGGEVIGVIVSVGLFSLGQVWAALVTFAFAYTAGIVINVAALVGDGEEMGTALKDSFATETASIFVMEVVAIGADFLLAGEATLGDPLFWSSLVVSLTAGLVAAYPVNLWLIKSGVKEAMGDPSQASAEA